MTDIGESEGGGGLVDRSGFRIASWCQSEFLTTECKSFVVVVNLPSLFPNSKARITS